MVDKVIDRKYKDGSSTKVIRFSCDCGDQGHNLDFLIEHDETGKVRRCLVSPYLAGKAGLCWRIKTAWRNLRGLDGQLGDMVIRPEDYGEMVKLGRELTFNPNTCGT